ncbi:MAG: pilus assembly PilX N-terminal domain-containing protein [Nitrospinaceae bacterium]|nr:pilus assembly PilX N-terminal domain-containing protein [Nitrospinaceae bacterium]
MARDDHSQNGYYKKNVLGFVPLPNQKGIALIAGLVFLTVLSLLIITTIRWASDDITRTKNYVETRQATYIAEAGIQMALNYFNYDSSGNSPGEVDNGFDDELVGGSDWPTGTFSNIALGSGGGTYTVTIDDNAEGDGDNDVDTDNSVILTSTGTISGVTATIEAVIYRPLFTSQFAILSEGDVKVAGSSTTITGTNGSVHTNSDFTQTGTPTISEGSSSSGTCSGSTCGSAGGASTEFVPTFEPSDFEQYADYIFNDDGTIDQRNADGSITTGVEANSIFDGFSHHNTQGWSVGGNSAIGTEVPNQAFLYFKDDFRANSIGSSGTPWEITLVVEESISWTGNAYISNWKDSALTPDLQNLFLIAENDIKINSLDQDTQGIIACKDQASLSGGANIEGALITKNLTTSDNTVNGTETDGSGGLTITYNGDVVTPVLSNKVSILSWQET